MMELIFESYGPGSHRVDPDGCVKLQVFISDHAHAARVKWASVTPPPGWLVLEAPASHPQARITQHFELVVPPGGGMEVQIIKTKIKAHV